MTNCNNCGAPLHGSVCEYCGTDYSREPEFSNCGGFGCTSEQMSKAMLDFANAIGSLSETHHEDSLLTKAHKELKGAFYGVASFDQFPKSAKAGDCVLCRDNCGIDRLYMFNGAAWKVVE